MKLLVMLTLVFVLSLATAFPRKHKTNDIERGNTVLHRGEKKTNMHEAEHEKIKDSKAKKLNHHISKEVHTVYKKFGMFSAPSLGLEDSSETQGQAVQQVLVPVSSSNFAQSPTTAPEMVSSDMVPVQRATLGNEEIGDQSTTQAAQAITGQSVQTETEQPQAVQFQDAPGGATEDNSVANMQTTQDAKLEAEEASANPTQIVQNAGNALEMNAQNIQSFTKQDSGRGTTDEMKDLQVYNSPLTEGGEQKPHIDGVSPQEEVKIVNLGDDEKTASLHQDSSTACGGCPEGAQCVNGQCQIREEDAQKQGPTGKGSASNPGSISDIHSLEAQELTSLLKDASKADTSPTAIPESPTESPVTTANPSKDPLEDHPEQVSQHNPQSVSTASPTQPLKPATFAQTHFAGEQLKELRDFARMYKMYQFIRKMEERLNDPDCAPVCRKVCKQFCPEKCCSGPKGNTSVVTHLTETTGGTTIPEPKSKSLAKQDKSFAMENDDDDSEEQDEKGIDRVLSDTGKKHILIRIVKNNELDKPRNDINRETV